MHSPNERDPANPSCSGCSGCPADELIGTASLESSLSGGRLVAASTGFFLGPLILAVLGAVWFDQSGASELLGAVAGLATGMAVSVFTARLLVRLGKENG